MKATSLVFIASAMTLTSLAFAGSEIKDATITNISNASLSANLAIGKGAQANLGSVNIENSKVEGSKVTNLNSALFTPNLAIGQGAEANSGSTVIK